MQAAIYHNSVFGEPAQSLPKPLTTLNQIQYCQTGGLYLTGYLFCVIFDLRTPVTQ